MTKKQIIGICSAVIFILAVLIGGWFYCFRTPPVNYLIPGVPYYGIYNLYFQKISSDKISPVLSILDYWGDKRFTAPDLKHWFTFSRETSSTTPSFKKSEIENFFTKNGYESSEWLSTKPNKIIKQIKKYVNPEDKIPVIVLPSQTINEGNSISLFIPQVVIGVFDDLQKVIVHDPYYGNNYEIPYDDFKKTFQPTETGILAIWPSNKIKEQIEGPNYDSIYPKRTESMSEAGTLLATKHLSILWFLQMNLYEEAIATGRELFDDPGFEYLPSAFQVVCLIELARAYLGLDQINEAIKIINDEILPINKNLSQVLPGWIGPISERSPAPYYLLSLAYLAVGEKELAINSYKEMKLINIANSSEVGEDRYLRSLKIQELEKEISF